MAHLNPDDVLQSLIAEILDSDERGEQIDFTMLCEQYPAHAESLKEFYDNHQLMKRESVPNGREPLSQTKARTPATLRTVSNQTLADNSILGDHGPLATLPNPCSNFAGYELLEEIARGGMGIVYRARQLSLNRVVAIKMILSGQFAGAEDIQRFRSEAEAAAQLTHPGIVPIYEIGEQNDLHYYSMAFVDGMSLAHVVADEPVPPREAAQLVSEICSAMAYAHSRGVIHRDLKPANIMVDPEGHPKVTDFGLAKRMEINSDFTRTGQVLGTPGYMSPEQAVGGAHDEIGLSVDVYSLGAVLYCLLTGRPPYQAATPVETLLQVLERDALPPRQRNSSIPIELETICQKCLSKNPSERYPSMDSLREDISRFLAYQPILAKPTSRLKKALRLCQRNPATAAWAATCAVTLLVATVVSGFFAITATKRARSELQAKSDLQRSLADVRREKARADNNARRADERARQETLAKQDALEQLRQAHLAEAKSLQWSGREGQRFSALDVLTKAAEIRPGIELRNQAIASLSLVDFRRAKQWDGYPSDSESGAFDDTLTLFAKGNMNGDVTIERIEDGLTVQQLPGFGARTEWKINRFSHNGNYLAVGYSGAGCWIWDIRRAKPIIKIPFSEYETGFDFSPNDTHVAFATHDGKVRIYDIATGEIETECQASTGVYFVKYSPDGEKLAVCGNLSDLVQIFDLTSGEVCQNLHHPGQVYMAAWHPNGQMLAVNSPPIGICIWDTLSGEKIRDLKVAGITNYVEFTPSGKFLISGGWDGKIRCWDPLSGSQLMSFSGVPSKFSRDGSVLAGLGGGKQIVLWDVAYATECKRLASYDSKGVVFHPYDSVFLEHGTDGISIFDRATQIELGHINRPDVYSLSFSPDGNTFYTSGHTGVQRWPLRRIPSPEKTRWQIGSAVELWPNGDSRESAMSKDGRYLAIACKLGGGGILELASGMLREFGPHAGMNQIAISPDGKYIVTGAWRATNGTRIWETQSGKLLHVFQHSALSSLPRFSPDGRTLVVGTNERYQFYEVGSWALKHTIERDNVANIHGAIAFSPDGAFIALNFTRFEVRLYAATDFTELASFGQQHQLVHSFCPDSRRLFVTEWQDGHQILRVWDLQSLRKTLAKMNLDWQSADNSQTSNTTPRELTARATVELEILP